MTCAALGLYYLAACLSQTSALCAVPDRPSVTAVVVPSLASLGRYSSSLSLLFLLLFLLRVFPLFCPLAPLVPLVQAHGKDLEEDEDGQGDEQEGDQLAK